MKGITVKQAYEGFLLMSSFELSCRPEMQDFFYFKYMIRSPSLVSAKIMKRAKRLNSSPRLTEVRNDPRYISRTLEFFKIQIENPAFSRVFGYTNEDLSDYERIYGRAR